MSLFSADVRRYCPDNFAPIKVHVIVPCDFVKHRIVSTLFGGHSIARYGNGHQTYLLLINPIVNCILI